MNDELEILSGEVVEMTEAEPPAPVEAGELITIKGSTFRRAVRGGAGERMQTLPDPPWERGRGEKMTQHNLFLGFLAMGPDRTVARYGRENGISLGKLGALCGRFRWHERAQLYDSDQARRQLQLEEQSRREMAKRHAEIAMTLQERALTRLAAIEPDTLDARDVARFLDVATRLERLARGEPTEITENEHRHSVKTLSDDELDAFERGA